jgi:hypothetical protein
MKYVTVKDFGDVLGVNGVTIRQRILRKKLIKHESGLIDVTDVLNFNYILGINGGDLSVFDNYYKSIPNGTNVNKKFNKATKKQTFSENNLQDEKVEQKVPAKSTEITQKVENEKPSKIKGSVRVASSVETEKVHKETQEERLEKKRVEKQRRTFQDLELRKKEADVLFVERQSELKQIQLEKIAGNTLPLDITANLLKINLQQIFKTFSIELENLATISVETLGGTRADLVKITNAQNAMLKKIVETAKVNANQEIEIYLQEYSETRSRGERKS